MVYRYTLISIAAALLLGACSKNDDAESTAEAATASESADAGSGAANAQAEARKQDYWPLLAPLVAGTYAGECQQVSALPNGAAGGAAITLTADGKATAPGHAADMHHAKRIMLSRELRNGEIRAFAMLATAENDGTILSLHNDKTADGRRVSIAKGIDQFACSNAVALDTVSKQPLYIALAKAIESPGQALTCVDVDNLARSYNAEFKLANGMATLGKDAFDISKAQLETLSADENASQLSYSFALPDGQSLHVFYDDVTGKVKSLQGRNTLKTTHMCDVKA